MALDAGARWCGSCGTAAPPAAVPAADPQAPAADVREAPAPRPRGRRSLLTALALVALVGILAAAMVLRGRGEQAPVASLPAGAELWRAELPQRNDATFLDQGMRVELLDDIVIVSRVGRGSEVLDRGTGQPLWRHPGFLEASDGQVVVRTAEGLDVLDRRTGAVVVQVAGAGNLLGRIGQEFLFAAGVGAGAHQVQLGGRVVDIPGFEGLSNSMLQRVSSFEGWTLLEQSSFSSGVGQDPQFLQRTWVLQHEPFGLRPDPLVVRDAERPGHGKPIVVGDGRALVERERGLEIVDLATFEVLGVHGEGVSVSQIVAVDDVLAVPDFSGMITVVDRQDLGELWTAPGRLFRGGSTGVVTVVPAGAAPHTVRDPATGGQLGTVGDVPQRQWIDRHGVITTQGRGLRADGFDDSATWTWGEVEVPTLPVEVLAAGSTTVTRDAELLFFHDRAGRQGRLRPISSDAILLAVPRGLVLAEGRDVRLLESDGGRVWSERLGSPITAVEVREGVVHVRTEQRDWSLAMANGAALDDLPFPDPAVSGVGTDGEALIVGERRIELGLPIAGVREDAHGIVVTAGTFLIGFDTTGHEQWRVAVEDEIRGAPALAPSTITFVLGTRTIVQVTRPQ